LNYKKEESKRAESLAQYVGTGMILKLLPILDNFSLAEKELPKKLEKNNYIKGLLQIKGQIESFLKDEGVSAIESVNKKFDPSIHEVIGAVEKKGVNSGIIIEEVLRGYKIRDQLLRPAKVRVAK